MINNNPNSLYDPNSQSAAFNATHESTLISQKLPLRDNRTASEKRIDESAMKTAKRAQKVIQNDQQVNPEDTIFTK